MQLRLIFKTLSEESLKTIKGDSDYTLQNTVKIMFFKYLFISAIKNSILELQFVSLFGPNNLKLKTDKICKFVTVF